MSCSLSSLCDPYASQSGFDGRRGRDDWQWKHQKENETPCSSRIWGKHRPSLIWERRACTCHFLFSIPTVPGHGGGLCLPLISWLGKLQTALYERESIIWVSNRTLVQKETDRIPGNIETIRKPRAVHSEKGVFVVSIESCLGDTNVYCFQIQGVRIWAFSACDGQECVLKDI